MDRKKKLEEEIRDRQPLFQGDYLLLERLIVRLPDGREGKREIVRVPDAVAVLLMEGERVHMVRQNRPAIGRTLLEIPAGLIGPGESPEDAAIRECEEETGFRPGRLERLMVYAHAEGYSTGMITLFLGTDPAHTGRIQLDETEHLIQESLSFDELAGLVLRNELFDSKTIMAVLILLNRRAAGL